MSGNIKKCLAKSGNIWRRVLCAMLPNKHLPWPNAIIHISIAQDWYINPSCKIKQGRSSWETYSCIDTLNLFPIKFTTLCGMSTIRKQILVLYFPPNICMECYQGKKHTECNVFGLIHIAIRFIYSIWAAVCVCYRD